MFPLNLEQLTTLELTAIWLVVSAIFLLAIAAYSYFQKGE